MCTQIPHMYTHSHTFVHADIHITRGTCGCRCIQMHKYTLTTFNMEKMPAIMTCEHRKVEQKSVQTHFAWYLTHDTGHLHTECANLFRNDPLVVMPPGKEANTVSLKRQANGTSCFFPSNWMPGAHGPGSKRQTGSYGHRAAQHQPDGSHLSTAKQNPSLTKPQIVGSRKEKHPLFVDYCTCPPPCTVLLRLMWIPCLPARSNLCPDCIIFLQLRIWEKYASKSGACIQLPTSCFRPFGGIKNDKESEENTCK